MKILFLFHGTTHYFNLIISQINKQPDVEILYIYPKIKSKDMGEGVFQTTEGANFRLFEFEEKISPDNYCYFEGLEKFIIEDRPDIILLSETHLKSLFYDKKLNDLIRKQNIKIILKSIPFRIKKYDSQIENYKVHIKNAPLPAFSSLPGIIKKIAKQLKFDVLYKSAYIDRVALKSYLKKLNLQKELYNLPDAHVNYIEEAYEIYGSYSVPKEKIFITYNSPDSDLLFAVKSKIENEPPILSENKFRIIHLSRLAEWKRVDMLITAVANLKKDYPEIELLVVGEGPEKEKLINQAKMLAVEDSIKFLGAVYDPALLGKYLMSSSIYILAGMGGLSINDAMIFGLPVICSVCDGTEKFLVKEGFNGLYFEAGNQISLESKIKHLFSAPELSSKMGKNSVRIIKEEINIHTVVAGYMKAFKHVTKNLDKKPLIK